MSRFKYNIKEQKRLLTRDEKKLAQWTKLAQRMDVKVRARREWIRLLEDPTNGLVEHHS